MSDRTFLDTNIFVYSFDRYEPKKAAIAHSLIRHAIDSRTGAISYQVIQEFYSVALTKFPIPMSAVECERYCGNILVPLLAIQSSAELFIRGLRLHREYSLSWYDALILAAALELECETLFSEDFQDGQNFASLKIKNPFRAM
jgi:predicted nucleic acid-binding protein